MASLADQADHSPAFFPLLQMPEFEIRQLTPTQPAPEQDRKDRAVSLAFQRIGVRRLPTAGELLRL